MEIKIHENNYKIIFVKDNDKRLLMEDEEYHTGVTDFIKKEIYLKKGLHPDTLRYTILHELTHAFIESYGFLQVDWDDEIISDFVANYIAEIGVAHNKIIDWIDGKDG